jgi:hypothetical protein
VNYSDKKEGKTEDNEAESTPTNDDDDEDDDHDVTITSRFKQLFVGYF